MEGVFPYAAGTTRMSTVGRVACSAATLAKPSKESVVYPPPIGTSVCCGCPHAGGRTNSVSDTTTAAGTSQEVNVLLEAMGRTIGSALHSRCGTGRQSRIYGR